MIYMDLRDEIIERGWNSGKIEDETIEIRSLMSLRNRELSSLDETRIRITLCLSFTKLTTINGFDILLILVDKIKRDMT